MSNPSVGQVDLGLNLNTNPFQKQLSGIQNQANTVSNKLSPICNKIGGMIAAAFSVKVIIDFGKECINLGSDLQEVQNVVDVTFTSMSDKVDKFTKNAITSSGMSETLAKKYVGTFGSMSKAFGFTENQAYDMATSLTSLAGDVASFYNLDHDTAYTKLKSVFTGETESLKDLGVVMTQTALDSFALANGFGKTTKSMTEAEKVSLRYAFVQQQLSAASGDFIRTSGGWANQTRVLKLQFESLQATLGQAFIKVLTPVVQMLNQLMLKLQTAAEMFSNFINSIFGEGGNSAAGSTASAMAEAAQEMNSSSGAVSDDLATASEKAKEIKNNLAGFDKLNVLDTSSSSDSGTSTTAISAIPTATIPVDADTTKAEKSINLGLERIKKVFNQKFGGIGKLFTTLFKTLSKGVSDWWNKDKGKIAGYGTLISTNLQTGFSNLGEFFNNLSNIASGSIERMSGEIQGAIGTLLGGFTTFYGSLYSIYSEAFAIATGVLNDWVVEDSAIFGEFFDNIISKFTDVATLIGTIFGDIGDIISNWWNGEDGGKGIFENVCKMFTDIGTTMMNVYNKWIQPVWNFIMGVATDAWNQCLKPVFEAAISFFGKVADCIATVWNNFLSPIVNWFIDVMKPVITNVLNVVRSVFSTVFKFIGGLVSALLKSLGGIIDFITGVFSGDWEKAWNGIKDFIGGIWDGIWNSIKFVINLIVDGINALWSGIYTVVQGIVNGIGGIAGAIGELIGADWHFSMPEQPPLIPKLAKGGLVTAPTLALVGDNKNAKVDPEVVAPLSKLQSIINKEKSSSNSDGELIIMLSKVIRLLENILDRVNTISISDTGDIVINIDGEEVFRIVRKKNNQYKKRHGQSAFA